MPGNRIMPEKMMRTVVRPGQQHDDAPRAAPSAWRGGRDGTIGCQEVGLSRRACVPTGAL